MSDILSAPRTPRGGFYEQRNRFDTLCSVSEFDPGGMNLCLHNQTVIAERNSRQLSSFLEEREVSILTNLEPFYPRDHAESASMPQRVLQVNMTLDRTAQDITKEL